MTDHPYRQQPDSCFWSRAVSNGYSPTAAATTGAPFLRKGDVVVSAGSCFASNMIPWLEAGGLTYVRTEEPHPAFAQLPENLGYRAFSAAYGNIYTARHLRQLYERASGAFTPAEDRWHVAGKVVDPFRPGLRHPASSDKEFDLLTAQHLAAVRTAFESATVFVFTLGLTEAWEATEDGAVYPACPGTVAGLFHPARHRFRNFTVEEVTADLTSFIRRVRLANPALRVVLTVSPVPLVATATRSHVLVATTYSKAVLRVAAQQVCEAEPDVAYFPAYEIITGPQADHGYFAEDRRNVTEAGVTAVMTALMANSQLPVSGVAPQGGEVPKSAGLREGPGSRPGVHQTSPTSGAKRFGGTSFSSLNSLVRRILRPRLSRQADGAGSPLSATQELSRRVAEAECDEVMQDR